MKFSPDRPYSDPEKAARRLLEIANAVEAVQDGRIPIEKINAPFLFRERATPAEYSAGLKLAIERGWLVMHESGTIVRFTQAGVDLFASAKVQSVDQRMRDCAVSAFDNCGRAVAFVRGSYGPMLTRAVQHGSQFMPSAGRATDVA
jgi:hypothetical protein